ncbi:DnaJ domain-containing protein [Alphaproteobacteria bacterium]|nr:DnaJ domain-containing protein [Alphaproteobacteria bacterium]
MPWLVLGIAIVIGLILIGRGLFGPDPKRAIKLVIIIILVCIGIGGIFVLARGGGAIPYIVGGLLLPIILRWRAVQQFMRNLAGPSQGQTTGVETRFLRMNLDHDSGILDGMVLDGQFRGRRLSELQASDLSNLLRECRVEDEESATVLEAYLDRNFGGSWRTGEERDRGAGTQENSGRGRSSPWSAGTMSRDEAFEILGLQPGATTDAIKDAHHTLMKKNHPDQGGSNYLATKINQAKELLLDE